MNLNEIISELNRKKKELEAEHRDIEKGLEQMRSLHQDGENLKEKIISIGFAIQRLQDIQNSEDAASAADTAAPAPWGDIDGVK